MITGIILISISILGFIIIKKSDLENVVVENESFGRVKLYLGISIIFIIGVVSIINSK